jgi:trimethylamine:corrinoid methyltransferase-like protein
MKRQDELAAILTDTLRILDEAGERTLLRRAIDALKRLGYETDYTPEEEDE